MPVPETTFETTTVYPIYRLWWSGRCCRWATSFRCGIRAERPSGSGPVRMGPAQRGGSHKTQSNFACECPLLGSRIGHVHHRDTQHKSSSTSSECCTTTIRSDSWHEIVHRIIENFNCRLLIAGDRSEPIALINPLGVPPRTPSRQIARGLVSSGIYGRYARAVFNGGYIKGDY